MTSRDKRLHAQLQEDLAALRLTYFSEHYVETLDEAAPKNTSMKVRFTRTIDMISVLTTAQLNGTLEKNSPSMSDLNFSFSMSWDIFPSINEVPT